MRARFHISILQVGTQHVIALVDTGNGMSITNDAEGVIAYLSERNVLRAGDRVIYQDTEGRWDELRIRDGRFTDFGCLAVQSLEDALLALRANEGAAV